ncbi:MAG: YihY/virulence factor BrkB family protein [Bacteroidales bacterium]|jgi:membrane protein|nr:YihY/virulence factor BrkB family protein [Bacteroidales bacterium]
MKERLCRLGVWWKKKLRKILIKANKITLPGFQGKSVYHVGNLFLQGLSKGYIADRAAAVAFNFFTALFPMLLTAFTLIPYIPIDNFQENLLYYAQVIIPPEIWDILNDTVAYIITHKLGNLLSIGFILSLYFGTNGVNSLFNAFHQTYHHFTSASNWFKQRWYAFLILMSALLLITIGIAILGYGNRLINLLMTYSPIASKFIYYLFQSIRILLAGLVLMSVIAMTYYFATPKKRKFLLFSPGTIISSFLIMGTTWGFSFFISNFSRYNILYGSLGTILILTLFLYLNSMFILIGFEINMSINSAKVGKLKVES